MWLIFFLEGEQLVKRDAELALEAGFVAIPGFHGPVLIAEGAHGHAGADGLGQVLGGADGSDLALELLVDGGAFDVPEAVHAPGGGDHLVEIEPLGGVLRAVGGQVFGFQSVEGGLGFAAYDHGVMETAFGEAVEGGAGFAFFGAGSGGVLCVGAVCGYLFFCCHLVSGLLVGFSQVGGSFFGEIFCKWLILFGN
ncbi:MAG: hypothetical protein QOJ99_4617 [Bryobacterales bacterium]|nr:hypothetical protein [Bryobacterales bacterium]